MSLTALLVFSFDNPYHASPHGGANHAVSMLYREIVRPFTDRLAGYTQRFNQGRAPAE